MARQEEELISLPEVAERVGLHRATVNQMVHDGRLPAERVGPGWFVRASDFREFRESYRRPPNAPKRAPVRPRPSVEILRLLGEWRDASVAELAEVVPMHIGNIRKHLRLAESQGLAYRDDAGSWHLTDQGDAVASLAELAEEAV